MFDKLALLISMASLVIVSIDMALTVVLSKKKADKWVKWNIVLCATLLGMSVFFVYNQLSAFLFEGMMKVILTVIFQLFFLVGSSFVLVLACRFVNWMLALPMSKWAIANTFALGVIYFVVSVLAFLLDSPLFDRIQSVCAGLSVSYCFFIMAVNYRNIANGLIKHFALVFSIICLSVLPLVILSVIYLPARRFVLAVIELAYFIVYLVFMFLAIDRAEKKVERKPEEELTVEDFAEYHITDREFEVIKLIRKGLTNKEIGFELGISVNTVNNHIANIFQKTGVRSRIDLLNVLKESAW